MRGGVTAFAAALVLTGFSVHLALAQGGPGMMMFGGPGSSPMMSNTLGLLMRPDVQTELRLDVRQRTAIAELMEQSRNRMFERMQQRFRNNGPQDFRNLPPEQRRQRGQEIREQMMAEMQAFQGEINDQIKKILRPEQIKRLYQLDLQWRGPLSMADPKVAEQIKLTPEHRNEILKLLNEFQQQNRELINKYFQQMRESGGFRPGQPPDFSAFQNPQSPLRREMDKNRKAAEEKALALLNAEEAANWKAAQGERFTFRNLAPAANFPRRF